MGGPTARRSLAGGRKRNAMESDSCRPEGETLEDPFQPASPGVRVEVMVEDPAWRRFLPRAEALARRAVAAALAGSGAAGLVTVLLADDRALRRLNGEHRGRDKPTNVLSFPGGA